MNERPSWETDAYPRKTAERFLPEELDLDPDEIKERAATALEGHESDHVRREIMKVALLRLIEAGERITDKSGKDYTNWIREIVTK